MSTVGLLVLIALSSILIAVPVESLPIVPVIGIAADLTMYMLAEMKMDYQIIQFKEMVNNWMWTSLKSTLKTAKKVIREASQELASDMLVDSIKGPDKTCRK